MKLAGSDGGRYLFSLEQSLERTRQRSRFLGPDSYRRDLFLLGGALLIGAGLYGIFQQGLSVGLRLGLASFGLLWALVAASRRAEMRCFRGLVKFYAGKSVPVLVMDAQGVDCPLVLLSYNRSYRMLRDKQASLKVTWPNIISWEKSRLRYYVIRLKEPEGVPRLGRFNLFTIDPVGISAEEENELFVFANSFLPQPIKDSSKPAA